MAAALDFLPLLLIVAAVAAFVAVSVVRLRRQMRRRQARPVTPVAVPPEEIELEEGPVQACMRCGSPHVRPANLNEGGIPGAGAMLFYICGRCGHRGPPLEFPDPTAYREFVKALHGEPSAGERGGEKR